MHPLCWALAARMHSELSRHVISYELAPWKSHSVPCFKQAFGDKLCGLATVPLKIFQAGHHQDSSAHLLPERSTSIGAPLSRAHSVGHLHMSFAVHAKPAPLPCTLGIPTGLTSSYA